MRWPASLLCSLAFVATGCAPRTHLCAGPSECAVKSACVAGRCQAEKPTVRPAVDTARRIVVRPVDMAYVKRGDGAAPAPDLAAIGRDGGRLFLRFAIALPREASVVEAYVVLHRSTLVDDDPSPLSLHAHRIVEGWKGGSVSWAIQPRTEARNLPRTVVDPSARTLVRLDVRDLVRHWSKRDGTDQGIAVLADEDTRTGTTFALTSVGPEREAVDPYLELYVR